MSRAARLLAVTLLALCVFGQAVYVKASCYTVTSPQVRHFSTSVKIANVAHHASDSQAAFAVLPGIFQLQQRQTARTLRLPEFPAQKPAQTLTSRLLRSPPVFL